MVGSDVFPIEIVPFYGTFVIFRVCNIPFNPRECMLKFSDPRTGVTPILRSVKGPIWEDFMEISAWEFEGRIPPQMPL